MYTTIILISNYYYIQYIFSYEPSKADVDTFSAIQAPQAKTPNVLRWYNHIKSFSDKERAQFPNKKAEFSTSSESASKPADDDDDDVDLFGSDDEEVMNSTLSKILNNIK